MIRFLALIALSAIAVMAQATAAQLVMFESRYCPACIRWNREIGGFYHKTEEGRIAPLRKVDMGAARPEDLKDIKGIHFTPTFVLLDDAGREVGRMEGYNGDEFFFFRLDQLMAKLHKDKGAGQ